MLVAENKSEHVLTRMTAYDVSGSEPKEQWTTAVDQEYGNAIYWGDWIRVGGNQLLKASDGSLTEAGWDEDLHPEFISDYALTCDERDHCTGWSASDPTTPLWEQDIDDSHDWIIYSSYTNGWAVHDGAPVLLAARDTAVRLTDGTLIELSINEDKERVGALEDGWAVYNSDEEEYRVLSPSGEEVDSFESHRSSNGARYVPLFEVPRLTAAQLRAMVVDDDVSWASVTSLFDSDKVSDCPAMFTIGEHSLAPVLEDDRCDYENETGWFSLSSDGSLLMYIGGSPSQTSSAVYLSAMWSVVDGEPVSFAGADMGEQPMWLVNPELIIAVDRESGQVTGYAPGKG